MKALDIVRIRRELGISQREMASALNMHQSFLSNIENGRCALPFDKMEKLIKIYNITEPEKYMIEIPDSAQVKNVQRTLLGTNTFTNNSMMCPTSIIEEMQKMFDSHAEKINKKSDEDYLKEQLEKSSRRIENLETRNDSLTEKNEVLQEKITELNSEIFRLREILAKNGISY